MLILSYGDPSIFNGTDNHEAILLNCYNDCPTDWSNYCPDCNDWLKCPIVCSDCDDCNECEDEDCYFYEDDSD